MSGTEGDIAEEQNILDEWRDPRPSPPLPPEEWPCWRVSAKTRDPKSQTVEVFREARRDPSTAAIWSRLDRAERAVPRARRYLRQTRYRHVTAEGQIGPHGEKLLVRRAKHA